MGAVKMPVRRKRYAIADLQTNADGIHVWHFDPALSLDVIHTWLSGRHPFRMNRHDYFELTYVHSGELVWQLLGDFVTQKAGELFVMGSTLFHRVTEFSQPRVRATALLFMPDVIRSSTVAGADAEYLMPFLMQDSGFPHIVRAKSGVPAQALDLFGRVNRELPVTTDQARLSAKTYLKMILVLLVNHYAKYSGTSNIFTRKQEALNRLRPLFEFVERHHSEPLGVHDVALVVGMSKSHFMRFFRGVTGQTFVTYLNHIRVAKAQALLALSDKSVADISQEVGFCDQSYFGLVFRRLAHMTPLHYRCNVRNSTEGETLSSTDGGPSKSLLDLQICPWCGTRNGGLALDAGQTESRSHAA